MTASKSRWFHSRYHRRDGRKRVSAWANLALTLLVKIVIEVAMRVWEHFTR
jgi:hypothetical protein